MLLSKTKHNIQPGQSVSFFDDKPPAIIISMCTFIYAGLVVLVFLNGGDELKEKQRGSHLFILLAWFESSCQLRQKHHSKTIQNS